VKKLRGAVIGCGLIAEFHLRGWQRLPEVSIMALVDPDRAMAEDRRAQFAPTARTYASLEEALAGEPLDFVDILTPPPLHAEHCLRAKAAGLHVICQKPLCDELEAARSLVAAFAGGPQLLCVHENHAYRPWFRQLAARHREGFFGAIRELHLKQLDATHPPQRLNLEARRGVLLQYGIHFIDLVRQLLGVPLTISATVERTNPSVRGDSCARVTFTYPAATADIEVAWPDAGVAEGGMQLRGERGEARYDGTMIRGGASRYRLAQGKSVLLDETRSTVDDYVEAFFGFEQAFVAALLHGAPAPQPAAENLQTLAMTFAAYASAERKAPVSFADFLPPS